VSRSFIAGGAGFIGSHLARSVLLRPDEHVVVYDNLTSGRRAQLGELLDDPRLKLVVGDLQDLNHVTAAMKGCDHVYHLAANPDISRAETEPTIDFWQGTYLCQNVLEAARLTGARRITYASGSGVYGDHGERLLSETSGPLLPVSTYGASKLACEALLSAYSYMFHLDVVVFRFANVVGPRQTHGVTFDFVHRLLQDPARLLIRGDGRQSKSYVHVADAVAAMLTLTDQGWTGFDLYNVGTTEHITVTEIADLVTQRMGLTDVVYEYTGGSRGWTGDVPVVRMSYQRIAARGWSARYTSRAALVDSIDEGIAEASPPPQ
jgi:UDP-glucose 4-epimerase